MSFPLSAEAALELAERIVAASGADETEVTVESVVDRFARFADCGPTQSADRERLDVAIRVRLAESGGGYREARATCTGKGEEGWRRALDRARALAGASPVDDAAEALGGAVSVPLSHGDAATLSHSFPEKARWIGGALAACQEGGLQPAGLARTGGIARALANSAGRRVCGELSRASFSLTASAGGGAASLGESRGTAVLELDVEGAVRRAVQRAQEARNPRAIEPGEYTVVLEPKAVSSILLFAGYRGFGAQEVAEESSFLCGRVGERVFAEDLEVWDDVGEPQLSGIPFDGEGSPRQRVHLIEAGTPLGPVTDRRTARKLGLECTGHARPQPSQSGPMAENLVVGAGTQSVAELIAGVERGLLITQFHYTNVIEPRELMLSGMTRNGTFWIDNGEVQGPVHNLRFTDSLVRALGAVDGISKEREAAGALFSGECFTPALRIPHFRFTSATEF